MQSHEVFKHLLKKVSAKQVAAELRLHPLSIFISVFGGLIVFGFTGLVLGPIILGVAVALLNVWQIRAQHEEA